MLEKANREIDLVLNISVFEENVVERISKRRVCRKCRAIYHLITNPLRRIMYVIDVGESHIKGRMIGRK